MAYESNTAGRDADLRGNAPSTGIPFWDMMLSFGKASQQAMAGYASRGEHAAPAAPRSTASVEVIPVGEETLTVGTRLVAGATTRVRRGVVETPGEQAVSLREERVVVERRKPSAASAITTQGVLTETAIEMSDSYEVAEVWKSVRVTEEVVLRREVTERVETVRDAVRHDEVVVEHVNRTLPVPRPGTALVPVSQPAPAAPQAGPETAQLAADLKAAVAEAHDKAARTEPKPATVQSTKAAAEPVKPAARTEAAPHGDKGGANQKH